MTYEFGDIILVKFPFTDLSATKKRPSVVISSQEYDQNKNDILLLAITSQIRGINDFGSLLITDWELCGLPKPSLFKPLIATIEKSCIFKKIGSLSKKDKMHLTDLIGTLIGDQE